jgi:hypothetical protein
MLDNDEAAILELLAIRPLSYFPPLPRSIAEQLALKGLAIFSDGQWYLTADGLTYTGRTLH